MLLNSVQYIGPRGNRRVYDQDAHSAGDARNRHDIADVIELEITVEGRIPCVICGRQKEGIAVWLGLHDRLRGEVAARAWPVLYDELLTKPFRKPLTYQTRRYIGRSGRSKADKQVYRPQPLKLGDCGAGQRQSAGS